MVLLLGVSPHTTSLGLRVIQQTEGELAGTLTAATPLRGRYLAALHEDVLLLALRLGVQVHLEVEGVVRRLVPRDVHVIGERIILLVTDDVGLVLASCLLQDPRTRVFDGVLRLRRVLARLTGHLRVGVCGRRVWLQ